MAAGGAVHRSHDEGSSWHSVYVGEFQDHIRSVKAHPQNPDSILAGGQLLHTSVDGGLTWKEANRGVLYYDGEYYDGTSIDHIYPFAAAIDATGSVLYLGGCDRGVLTSYLAERPQ